MPRLLLGALLAWLACAASGETRAQAVAADGCPLFHCTVGATGVMSQSFVPAVSTIVSNGSLGNLLAQGCSGNGTVLACLFSTDGAAGTAFAGTLKVLDATTLQPIWGSAGTPGSYDPLAAGATGGQVAVNFADGTFAAGDSSYYVHYAADGTVLARAPLNSTASNFGMTPISKTLGVVTQNNGILTLMNLKTWTSVSKLTLLAPDTRHLLSVVSPSSGANNTLYVVANDPTNNNGWLFAVGLNGHGSKLYVRSSFRFVGKAGASPVVATPAASGSLGNMILLPVSALAGGSPTQAYLLGVEDSPAGLELEWSVPVAVALSVAPTIDPGSQSLFYQVPQSAVLYQASIATGAPLAAYDIQAIGNFQGPVELNGHIGATGSGTGLTLLLAAVNTPHNQPSVQLVMTFQPLANPTSLLWSQVVSTTPAVYTEAWNAGPSSQTGLACPIAIAATASTSTIIRLCDF